MTVNIKNKPMINITVKEGYRGYSEIIFRNDGLTTAKDFNLEIKMEESILNHFPDINEKLPIDLKPTREVKILYTGWIDAPKRLKTQITWNDENGKNIEDEIIDVWEETQRKTLISDLGLFSLKKREFLNSLFYA